MTSDHDLEPHSQDFEIVGDCFAIIGKEAARQRRNLPPRSVLSGGHDLRLCSQIRALLQNDMSSRARPLGVRFEAPWMVRSFADVVKVSSCGVQLGGTDHDDLHFF